MNDRRSVVARLLVVVCMLVMAVGAVMATPRQARADGERYVIDLQVRVDKDGGGGGGGERHFPSETTSYNFTYNDLVSVIQPVIEQKITQEPDEIQGLLNQLGLDRVTGVHPTDGKSQTILNEQMTTSGSETWNVTLTAETLDTYFKVNAASTDTNKGTAEVTTQPDADDGLYKPSTINIKASPKPGYALKQWTLKREDFNFEDDSSLVHLDDAAKAETALVLGVEEAYAVDDPKAVTVTAEFEAINYSVGVSTDPADGSGGTASVTVNGTAATTATIGQKIDVTTTPATGYKLASLTYTYKQDGVEVTTDIAEAKSFTMPVGDVTILAKFVPVTTTHTITFEKNASDATGTMAAQPVPDGVATALTANAFSRPGYTFVEWNTDANGKGKEYADKAEVTATADMTLYAQWSKIPAAKHTITVVQSQNGTVTASAEEAAAGESVTLTAKPAAGCSFKGWAVTDAKGNAIEVTGGVAAQADDAEITGTFTMPESDVTASASFEVAPVVTRTISFEKNASDVTGTMAAQTVTEGVATALTANAFARAGYTFAGWNTAANGKGKAYADKAEVTATADTTLYAQWTKNAQRKVSIPEMGTSARGYIVSRSEEITYTITQKVPTDAVRVRIWFDLNETMYYTTEDKDVVVRTSSGVDIPATKTIDGQHLEVIIDNASQIAGDTIEVVYSAKLRSDANLEPYLNEKKNTASIPYQAHTEFQFADGTSETVESITERHKFAVGSGSGGSGSGGSGSGTKSSSSSGTSTRSGTTTARANTLARTADPSSAEGALVAAFAGITAIAVGSYRNHRGQS